jgi:hypothetical protein
MKKFAYGTFLIAASSLCLALAFTGAVTIAAAPSQTTSTHASKSRGAAPIKVGRDAGNPTRKVAAPASKGGAKTRGGYGAVMHIDNHTGYYIDIYVDGDYDGSVSPYGDLYMNEFRGSRRRHLAAVAIAYRPGGEAPAGASPRRSEGGVR